MTSKNLFFNLLKQEIKRKTWAFAMSMLTFFFAFPVVISILISHHSTNINVTQVQLNNFIVTLQMLLRYDSAVIVIITIITAIVCGLGAFTYLHSKKKVDMYHSLPIKREKLFAINYICGVLIYLIPYLINLAIVAIIIIFADYKIALIGSMTSVGVSLLFFLLIYTTTIVAVMLTGNTVISFLGMSIFFFYGPVVILLKRAFQSVFFKTVSHLGMKSGIYDNTSPILKYISILKNTSRGMAIETKVYVGIIIAIVLLVVLALVLHARRGSETAGRAMTFNWAKLAIKYALVITTSMGVALLFYSANMYADLKLTWYIFGLVAGLIISHSTIEIVYEFDFRAIWKNKRELILLGVIVSAMSCFFIFDLGKYDAYIPDIKNVDEMSIVIGTLDDYIYYENLQIADDGFLNTNYISTEEYRIKNVIFKEKNTQAAILNMAKKGVETAILDDTDQNNIQERTYIHVRYKFKNGEETYRIYDIGIKENLEDIKTIFASNEYKSKIYPIMSDEYNSIISRIVLDNGEKVEGDMIRLVLDAYKQDLKGITIDTLKSEMPIAIFGTQCKNNSVNQSGYTRQGDTEYIYIGSKNPIYPSFTNTIKILTANNISLEPHYMIDKTVNTLTATVRWHTGNQEYNEKYDMQSSTMEGFADINENMEISRDTLSTDKVKVYKDKTQIEEILKNAVPSEYLNFNPFYKSAEYSIELEVYGEADRYMLNYMFEENNIPEFIINDFK